MWSLPRPSLVSAFLHITEKLTVQLSHQGICSGHCLIMYVYIGEMDDSGGILTFFIPSRMDDGPD